MEQVCERPLCLKFNEATCKLYIVDAYFGLMVVGRKGGVAKKLVISVEGVPFWLTNTLDIDQNTRGAYLTDANTIFQIWYVYKFTHYNLFFSFIGTYSHDSHIIYEKCNFF